MLCFFTNLVWLGFHSMLGLGLCVFDVGVRVVVIVKWGLGLTNNSRFCRHGFIRFHDEDTVC